MENIVLSPSQQQGAVHLEDRASDLVAIAGHKALQVVNGRVGVYGTSGQLTPFDFPVDSIPKDKLTRDSSTPFGQLATPATPASGDAELFLNVNDVIGAVVSDGGFAGVQASARTIGGIISIPTFAGDEVGRPATFSGSRSNGSRSSPTKALLDDILSQFGGRGTFTGGALYPFADKAYMRVVADGDWNSSADTPTRLEFWTTPDGSNTPVLRLTIYNDGRVVVNGKTLSPRLSSDVIGFAEAYPRMLASNQAVLTSGILYITAIELLKGDVVSNIIFRSITTAAAGVTNYWAALYDGTVNPGAGATLMSQSTTSSAAWGANTTKTFPLSAAQTIQADGLYYLGLMFQGTTPPTMAAYGVNGNLANLSPVISASANASLTTTAPGTLSATTGSARLWGSVS